MIIVDGNPGFGTSTNTNFQSIHPSKWEYLEVQYDWGDDLKPTYDMLGKLGWEKVTSVFNPHENEWAQRTKSCRAIFKRPL